MNNEEEEEEEEDDENQEVNMAEKREENTSVQNFLQEKFISTQGIEHKVKSEQSQNSMKIGEESSTTKDISQNKEISKLDTNIAYDKKQKKNKKFEKSKYSKRQYDQDTHSDDYSMWLPPQNQSGDGRTNLNDKYGY